MSKRRVLKFSECMHMMRSRDAATQEQGYFALVPQAADYCDELIAEYHAEQRDHGLRCWLLELIGESRNPKALPLFSDLLASTDELLRFWAIWGLQTLDTPESRRELFDAGIPKHASLMRR